MKKFYKMRMQVVLGGISVYTEEYYLVHETECFYFVIPEWQLWQTKQTREDGETLYQFLKRKNVKVKRFGKGSGRFAFETKDDAFRHLKFLKRKQLAHMQRDIEFLKQFIGFTGDKMWHEMPKSPCGDPLVPDTGELVQSYFVFD